jgi:Zn-dependent peptidase ImmA (M78 family)
VNISLQPKVLKWARERAGFSETELAAKLHVPRGIVQTWESTGLIAVDVVQKLSEKTKTPFGYLFLKSPPENALPISDFRRVGGVESPAPSWNLLNTIYRCQRRQQWFRDYQIKNGAGKLAFVGSKRITDPVEIVAVEISKAAKLGYYQNTDSRKWEEAMRSSIENLEDIGIIVSRVGYSGHTKNPLSVSEFRGFALSDEYAPLIFVNGADAPAAQMFTLAHEVVHIWLGESAVSNLIETYPGESSVEKYCNAVAAEILVPMSKLIAEWTSGVNSRVEIDRLSVLYRVSKLVIARRARDAGLISPAYYTNFYRSEVAKVKKTSKGSFYNSKPYEASRRLSSAVIRETRVGNTMVSDALDLLGIKTISTLEKYAATLKLSI